MNLSDSDLLSSSTSTHGYAVRESDAKTAVDIYNDSIDRANQQNLGAAGLGCFLDVKVGSAYERHNPEKIVVNQKADEFKNTLTLQNHGLCLASQPDKCIGDTAEGPSPGRGRDARGPVAASAVQPVPQRIRKASSRMPRKPPPRAQGPLAGSAAQPNLRQTREVSLWPDWVAQHNISPEMFENFHKGFWANGRRGGYGALADYEEWVRRGSITSTTKRLASVHDIWKGTQDTSSFHDMWEGTSSPTRLQMKDMVLPEESMTGFPHPHQFLFPPTG